MTTPDFPRVLFVDQTGQMGGAELCLLDVVRPLAGRCRVLLMDDGPFRQKLETAGVDVTVAAMPAELAGFRRESGLDGRLPTMAWRLVRHVWSLRPLIREADLVYVNTQKAAVMVAPLARLMGKPVIWHMHDLVDAAHFGATSRRVISLVGKHFVSRMIAISHAVAEGLRRLGTLPPIEVVHNGIDPALFDAVAQGRGAALRRTLGLDGVPVLGVYGRVVPWKGQHVAIAALARLPGAHLLIVGSALFGGDGYVSALKAEAERLGVADRVHFLGQVDDIPATMAAVDLILHTSVAPEPFGRVIVEGMMAGRPVIATAGGAVAEIVDHGRTGLIAPAGGDVALAGLVSMLLSDHGRRSIMAAAGRAHARKHFDAADYVARVHAVIAEVGERQAENRLTHPVPGGQGATSRSGV